MGRLKRRIDITIDTALRIKLFMIKFRKSIVEAIGERIIY